LAGEPNAFGLAKELSHPPHDEAVPGGYFIVADVCSAALRSAAPHTCRDPSGVERTSVHAVVDARIAGFLRDDL
jgi:hypothetical protein